MASPISYRTYFKFHVMGIYAIMARTHTYKNTRLRFFYVLLTVHLDTSV